MRGYPQEMEDFVDAVREGREPLSGLLLAHETVRGHLRRVRVGARGAAGRAETVAPTPCTRVQGERDAGSQRHSGEIDAGREDIDAVINTVLQGDKRRVSWTRLLAHNVNNHLVSLFFVIESFRGTRGQPDAGTPGDLHQRPARTGRADSGDHPATHGRLSLRRPREGYRRGSVRSRLRGGWSPERLRAAEEHPHPEQRSATAPLVVKADRLALMEAVLNSSATRSSTPLPKRPLLSPSPRSVDTPSASSRTRAGIRPEEQSRLFTLGGTLSSKAHGRGAADRHRPRPELRAGPGHGRDALVRERAGERATFGIRLPLVTKARNRENGRRVAPRWVARCPVVSLGGRLDSPCYL